MSVIMIAVGQLLFSARIREVGPVEALWIFGSLLTMPASAFMVPRAVSANWGKE